MFVRESHFFVAEPPLLWEVEAHRREKNWVWSWATRTGSGEKKRSPKHAAFARRREKFTSSESAVTSIRVLAHAPGTI